LNSAGIVGLVFYLGAPGWLSLGAVPALAVFGYIRERWQHNWEAPTPHRWIEALAWGAGALVAAIGGLLF
jgi:hypothetical protein